MVSAAAHESVPVVVSIATVPSRIASLQPTLDSLLDGDLVPDHIFVTHPDFCAWEKSGYIIPPFFDDPAYCRGIVRRVVAPMDWGPGTKLLGALHAMPDDCIIVLADDDIRYHPSFLKGLVDRQRRDLGTSFSYYVHSHRGLEVGQGCDGITLWKGHLRDVRAFVDDHVTGTSVMFHDDLWLRFYLLRQRVKVARVPLPPGERFIYEQLVPNDILASPADAQLKRSRILDDHFERLLAISGIGMRERIVLRARGIRDRIQLYRRDGAAALRGYGRQWRVQRKAL